MSERDGELMHLTAESTSKESSSLVTQTASRLPNREIKIGKKVARRPESDRDRTKGESERDGAEEWTVIATLCSAHLLI